MVKDNLKENISIKTSLHSNKPNYIFRGSHACETQHLMYPFSVRTIPPLELCEEPLRAMEFPLPFSPPLHSLPTLTLQPIQLWLEKPLGFQSLQSFDHNEFQSLPPPTLCSHLYLTSYKEESAEWRDKERKAVIDRNVQRENHTQKIKPGKNAVWKHNIKSKSHGNKNILWILKERNVLNM